MEFRHHMFRLPAWELLPCPSANWEANKDCIPRFGLAADTPEQARLRALPLRSLDAAGRLDRLAGRGQVFRMD